MLLSPVVTLATFLAHTINFGLQPTSVQKTSVAQGEGHHFVWQWNAPERDVRGVGATKKNGPNRRSTFVLFVFCCGPEGSQQQNSTNSFASTALSKVGALPKLRKVPALPLHAWQACFHCLGNGAPMPENHHSCLRPSGFGS